MSWWIFGKKEEVKQSPSIEEIPIENVDNTIENIGVTKELSSSNPNFSVAKRSEPFFVRIDKFQDARKNLTEIGKRLKDMENVLEKINETKIKEDEEISSWKEEMKNIRSNLSTIDQNLFSRVQF